MAALEYVFPLELTEAWKEEIKTQTRVKLEEMLGVEVDNVMAEYVIVMVGNKKTMAQIAHDLVDFIGDESAQQFVAWFGQLLARFEAQAHTQAAPAKEQQPEQQPEQKTEKQTKLTTEQPAEDKKPVEDKQQEAMAATTQPTKRVVSLKSVTSTTTSGPKKMVSLSGSSRSTIRSLNSSAKDMDDVLARRSQRFGVVDKSTLSSGRKTPPASTQMEPRERGSNKHRANDRDAAGGKLTQRLGPPVNVDQAELDARASLKKRRGDDRDQQHKKKRRGDDRDRDQDMEDSSGHNGKRRSGGDSREVAPPLPPSDDRQGGKYGRNGPRDMGPPMGFQGPPGYGGYPPYGAPMFYPPPGYGMPPYGMGFPPQGMPPQYGGRSYPRPPGGNMGGAPHAGGPRGPRGFQNRTWVNPNIAKAEEAKASETSKGEAADGAGAGSSAANAGDAGLNPNAPAFAPRNSYFGSSQMRPHFQNKTWVRPDPTKDAELDSSLPKTPPKELEDME